ncbi:hypothetical protein [Jeotgalibacillus salarius]|uniref:Uncharacterized protein n=1 Tax=Jeotgalibacillus salarius TaxID=546023 RepID=A0A4Y8LG41_9BACL|nr:hypothetical protein [Jeotgalibacillus salarius]TFD99486.1 hypothetical protein E2626_14600 [Jeotgalibacillus salarius]
MPQENKIASILKMIGYIIFGLTVVVAFIQFPMVNPTFLTLVLTFFSGFVTGMVFIALGEIIELLQSIHNRQLVTTDAKEVPRTEVEEEAMQVADHRIGEFERAEIVEFFEKKGQTVTNIQPMEKAGYYLVTVGGEKLVVELGGFQPAVRKKY